MTSKNGRPELVSLLQYMKDTRLDNPEITVMDKRIVRLAEIVEEVKQSDEWEDVKMSILSVGIEKGKADGRIEGRIEGKIEGRIEGKIESKIDDIIRFLSEYGPIPEELKQQILAQTDLAVLSDWVKKAARADSIEAFMEAISAFSAEQLR